MRGADALERLFFCNETLFRAVSCYIPWESLGISQQTADFYLYLQNKDHLSIDYHRKCTRRPMVSFYTKVFFISLFIDV
jgi:hypothetical protein